MSRSLASSRFLPAVCALLGALLLLPAASRAQRAASRGNPDARTLATVLADVERAELADNVGMRLERGLPVLRLPDLSLAAATRRSEAAAARLRTLARVRDGGLSEEERVTLRMLRWDLGIAADDAKYYWLSFAAYTPYAAAFSARLPLAVQRGMRAAPLRSMRELTQYERLLAQLPTWVDSLRAGLEARAARGIYISRQEIPAVAALWRGFAGDPAASTLVPSKERLSSFYPEGAEAARTRMARTVAERLVPALAGLAGYIEGAYRDAAPAGVGLAQYAGGTAYYRHLVRRETTTELTPREIHEIGLREVARIDAEMAAIRRELGFTGTADEFHAALRRDPRFYAATPDEVRSRYMGHIARILPLIPQWFSRVPRAQGDARRLDSALEPTMTYGFYQQPNAADSMGHYLFNGSKLAERSQINAAAVIYHELIPGHHFHFSLQQESRELPEYRRQAFTNAFVEGWGEYSSTLAGEMGLYGDPYDRYGRLFLEMFLTVRLVVDTGMNEFGWPRDSAIAFMRPRVAESPTQLETETLRYSTDIPAQALAYKLGALEILRLREEARKALGARFDIREFHAIVLGSGSLPMAVLQYKVRRWIETHQ